MMFPSLISESEKFTVIGSALVFDVCGTGVAISAMFVCLISRAVVITLPFRIVDSTSSFGVRVPCAGTNVHAQGDRSGKGEADKVQQKETKGKRDRQKERLQNRCRVRMREREREREREGGGRQIDRQRQTETETDRHTETETDRQRIIGT